MSPQRVLENREWRSNLPERYTPYWQPISRCRLIGYQKRGPSAYWVARYRTRSGTYHQKRLGLTDDGRAADGKAIITYDEAVARAKLWFGAPNQFQLATPEWRITTTKDLSVCPIGVEFTIGHALHDYVEWKRLTAAKSDFAVIISLINGHIVPKLASLLVKDLTPDVIRKFIQDLLETPPRRGGRPVGPRLSIDSLDSEALRKRKKTVNMVLSVIRTSLRMAWENEKINDDRIWRRIGRFRGVDRAKMLHLSRDECRRLLSACRPDLRQLVLGALYTGCRATELIRMRCSAVGRDGYGVYVTPVKTYRPRFVFLPDEGMAWFLALAKGRDPDEPLFVTNAGRTWIRSYHRTLFKAAVREARLPSDFSFHGLRHTYASQLVQSGTPVFAVADQLGHANPTTIFRTYGHLSPQIRESEVRQRFTPLDPANAQAASKQRARLAKWRKRLHGVDGHTYAKISDLRSRVNTE